MNKKQKFEKFLESLKGNGHDVLIESMERGFQACFESFRDEGMDVTQNFIQEFIKKETPKVEQDNQKVKHWDNVSDGVMHSLGRILRILLEKEKMGFVIKGAKDIEDSMNYVGSEEHQKDERHAKETEESDSQEMGTMEREAVEQAGFDKRRGL